MLNMRLFILCCLCPLVFSRSHHHNCHHLTKKAINETLQLGDIVVSATVRQLVVNPTNNKLQTATIRVKRIFKGRKEIGDRRDIEVDGIDIEKCRSRLWERDTKVFSLNISDGKYHLAASILPVTLNVLDSLHSIVTKRTIRKRHRSKPSFCEINKCPFGSKCVPSTGKCECRSSCRSPGLTVCGSDNVTYASHCHLSVRACILQKQGLSLRAIRPGSCEKKNPCDDLRCGPGEDCVVSQKNGVLSAHCVCPSKCVDYGDSVDSSPVCSSHGEDYKSLCHLKQHACQSQLNITVKYYGQCDPCRDHFCSPGTVCKLGEHRRPECRCSQQCPLHHDPVCATDGNTYENECVMRVAACKEDRQLNIYKRGKCKEIGNPCSSVACWHGEQCEITGSGRAVCKCQEKCPMTMKPVCGMDGVTYDNECELHRAGCNKRRRNDVRHEGTCGLGVCSTFSGCKPPQVCVPSKQGPRCTCPQCGDELREVCGSDGRTYPNECKMRQTSCLTGREIYVKYNGICEGCEKESSQCQFYAVCVSDGRGNGKCLCATDCPTNANAIAHGGKNIAVCGTDGVTYSSECHLRKSACQQKKFIMVAFEGKCDACQHVECHYGQECRGGECVCNYQCDSNPSESAKVCGEDGVLYPSDCHIQLASCKKGAPIHEMPSAHCHTSKETFKAPSYNCSESNCGFGGICMSPSNCHCPMLCTNLQLRVCGADGNIYRNQCHLNLISCRDQRAIHALPSVAYCNKEDDSCKCNRLGSYGPTCDGSGQCRCRAGVGGLKCDHCLPGFWGIHLIARGALSCQPCGCSSFGSARSDCEQTTGRCECSPDARGDKCDKCAEGLIMTHTGCVNAQEYSAPTTCLDHKCHHGARCISPQDGMPDCRCPENCDASHWGIAANMSVCGSDGSTYENYCQLTTFACKHQIDLVAANLGICDTEVTSADLLDRAERQKIYSTASTNGNTNKELGETCTFQSECASVNGFCFTRPSRRGLCKCGENMMEKDGRCEEVQIEKSLLGARFNGKQAAKLNDVKDLSLAFNFLIMVNAVASNGIILHARGANGDDIILKLEHRRILLEIGSEILQSRDILSLHSNISIEVNWRGSVCTLIVGEQSTSVRLDVPSQPIQRISIGGGLSELKGFMGCLRHLTINGRPVLKKHLSNSSEICDCDQLSCGENSTRMTSPATSSKPHYPAAAPAKSAVVAVDFDGSGFIEYPKVKMDVRNKVQLEIRVRPRSIDGLLFFWGSVKNGKSAGDFLALYLIASQPHFFWNLGSGIAYVKSSAISNHKWTTVKFGRSQRNGTIQLDDGFVHSQMSLPKNTHLDVSGESVFVGGIENADFLPTKLRPLNRTFEGAVQFLSINERFFNLDKVSTWKGPVRLFEGKPCSASACTHGVCQPRGNHHSCKCENGKRGFKCDNDSDGIEDIIALDGKKEITYLNRITTSVESSTTSNYSISFRTSNPSGTLLWEGEWEGREDGDFLIVYLSKDRLYFGINLGNDPKIKPVPIKGKVSDGKWHTVAIERSERKVSLQLDDHPSITVFTTPGSTELNTNGLVFLGGRSAVPPSMPIRDRFVGCVQNIQMNGAEVDVRYDVIDMETPELCS